jgi:hypothetical protein
VPGKTPQEAADNFIHFFRETLSCISDHYVSAFQQSKKLYKIYYDPYASVLDEEGNEFLISVTQVFRTILHPQNPKLFKAKTQEYSYRLLESGEDDCEIFAYHWHPHEPGVHYPHLHIQTVKRIHFPTSRVCLEDFVLLLIRDYGIRPAHNDYQKVLDKNKKSFEAQATWKIQHN